MLLTETANNVQKKFFAGYRRDPF